MWETVEDEVSKRAVVTVFGDGDDDGDGDGWTTRGDDEVMGNGQQSTSNNESKCTWLVLYWFPPMTTLESKTTTKSSPHDRCHEVCFADHASQGSFFSLLSTDHISVYLLSSSTHYYSLSLFIYTFFNLLIVLLNPPHYIQSRSYNPSDYSKFSSFDRHRSPR